MGFGIYIILLSSIVIVDIQSYRTLKKVFILADRFRNSLRLSNTTCLVKQDFSMWHIVISY